MYKKHRQARNNFLKEMGHSCAICGVVGVHIHEIASGPYRQMAFGIRAAWLAACDYCNDHVLTDKRLWPWSRQLHRKRELDPEGFDLAAFNAIIAPRSVSIEDVSQWNDSKTN